jgi:hypothetical protein
MVHDVPADILHCLYLSFVLFSGRYRKVVLVALTLSYVATARYVCLRFISKAVMSRRLKHWALLFKAGLAVALG